MDSYDRIKIACIAEFGMNGEVNAVKVAHKRHLDVEVVTAWLDANYVWLHKPGDVVRYTAQGHGIKPYPGLAAFHQQQMTWRLQRHWPRDIMRLVGSELLFPVPVDAGAEVQNGSIR